MADYTTESDYTPTAKEQETIKKVLTMFEVAKKSKHETTEVWRESESLYNGKHWEDFKMPDYKNELTLDLIESSIDTMIPILSSRPPKIDLIAYGGDERDKQIAEIMQGVVDETWKLRDMNSMVPEWLMDYLVYGTGILKVNFRNDDDLPDCDVVDPFSFFVNPSATKLENAEWVIYSAPTPLHEIRERYKKGKFVKSQSNFKDFEAMKMNEGHDAKNSKVQVQNMNDDTEWGYDNYNDAMRGTEKRALLIEVMMRDGSKDYLEENGKTIEKERYPGGVRMITIANNVVLYDGPTKYPFFNRENSISYPFPYVVLKNSGSAHSFWGKPEPKRLRSINLAMDRLTSQVLDNISLTANPQWIVDETAMVTDQISNKPGSIIRKKGPGTVKMETPSSVPGYVFNFYNLLMDAFEVVSGVNRATQGKADTNVTSGVQAQIYKQAATTKIDFKSRAVDQGIEILGQMWLTMFMNMGTKTHWISITARDGVAEQREVIGALFSDKKMTVRAKKGSMLPENRAFLENKILQLAQIGVLQDPEYILENMELPGKERLLNKMREQKEAQAQQPGMSDQMGEDPNQIFEQLRNNPELAQQVSSEMGEPQA